MIYLHKSSYDEGRILYWTNTCNDPLADDYSTPTHYTRQVGTENLYEEAAVLQDSPLQFEATDLLIEHPDPELEAINNDTN